MQQCGLDVRVNEHISFGRTHRLAPNEEVVGGLDSLLELHRNDLRLLVEENQEVPRSANKALGVSQMRVGQRNAVRVRCPQRRPGA